MHKVNVSLLFNQLAGMDIQRTFTFIIKPSKVNVMSLKYSNTTADFLEWDEAMNLIRKLYKDGNYNMSLLIALGCFFGLRIGDILSLRWNQILNTSEFTIIEKKTGKKRTIRINPQLQRHISEIWTISLQKNDRTRLLMLSCRIYVSYIYLMRHGLLSITFARAVQSLNVVIFNSSHAFSICARFIKMLFLGADSAK